MATEKLTEKRVAGLPAPTTKPQEYVWDEGKGSVTGFGVVVGKTGRAFIVRGNVGGKRVKVSIGKHGAPHPEGGMWTVELARAKAREILGGFAAGTNPNAPERATANVGPTLRDALDVHLARMRSKNRAEASIKIVNYEVTKYADAYLDRPISELTGAAMSELHGRIKASATVREGANAVNSKGAPLANRVITSISACWNSLNRKLEGKLGNWNPAKSVDKDTLRAKRERLDEDRMPGWLADVETMSNPIQRDGLMLALYTGLRSEDVRTIRWEYVDLDEATLRLPDPKGGENAAFTIPLSKTPLAILTRRREQNAKNPLYADGDGGWAFPSRDNAGTLCSLGDLREQRRGVDEDDEATHTRFPTESPHVLRRTWESIAHEEGISELDQHVLSNHSFGSHNVNATYISQHMRHLADCAARIDAGITRRLRPDPGAKKRQRRGRAHLKAV
jgi:integrase